MLTELRQELPEGCISDLGFDEWRAGELDAKTIETYEAHLEQCERCQRRHDAIEAQAEAFLQKFPTLDLPRANAADNVARLRQRQRSSLGWATGAIAGLLAAAAAIVLLVRSPPGAGDGAPHTDSAFSVRSKGSSHIGFFVKHGDDVRQGSDGQVVRPGDQLRFTLTSQKPQHVAILSLDGAQVASIYYPRGAKSATVTRVRDEAVNSSVQLDDTLGEEHVFGIFCDSPFDLEPLRDGLQRRGKLPELPGCTVDELTILKEAAP